ncbi:NBS-containing resistance-like protein [Dorcoceras hygrometricum]|uniref:NBS-containing resistance-like protein n=1 Tax=Dorcoceras hygrometricum TaxID=472368 RepID=A0A2Z7CI11_9LAMI|nr:NBS-containing resistance-like protein [Dorcoceras hygrometricum]
MQCHANINDPLPVMDRLIHNSSSKSRTVIKHVCDFSGITQENSFLSNLIPDSTVKLYLRSSVFNVLHTNSVSTLPENFTESKSDICSQDVLNISNPIVFIDNVAVRNNHHSLVIEQKQQPAAVATSRNKNPVAILNKNPVATRIQSQYFENQNDVVTINSNDVVTCVVPKKSNAIIGVVTAGFECLPPSCDGLTGPDDHGPMISTGRLAVRGSSCNQAGSSGVPAGRSPFP